MTKTIAYFEVCQEAQIRKAHEAMDAGNLNQAHAHSQQAMYYSNVIKSMEAESYRQELEELHNLSQAAKEEWFDLCS